RARGSWGRTSGNLWRVFELQYTNKFGDDFKFVGVLGRQHDRFVFWIERRQHDLLVPPRLALAVRLGGAVLLDRVAAARVPVSDPVMLREHDFALARAFGVRTKNEIVTVVDFCFHRVTLGARHEEAPIQTSYARQNIFAHPHPALRLDVLGGPEISSGGF